MRTEKPEDMTTGRKINKTGIGTSPRLAKEMIEGARDTKPSTMGNGERAWHVRVEYHEEASPIGSVPPPTSLKGLLKSAGQAITGKKPTVLIDRVAERMAFERTGVRLYDGLLLKHDALGGFDGGPSRGDLELFRAEELEHFALLKDCLERLGADPTAMTPGADRAAVESMGVAQVIADPRMDLAQSLHAILLAELADNDGWEMLIDLATALGQDEMATEFQRASLEEVRHLESVRRWLASYEKGIATSFDMQ